MADALLHHLMPLATLITPNLPEASILLGGMVIHTVDDMEAAARKLLELTGCGAVLVKGGHLQDHQKQLPPSQTPSVTPNGGHNEDTDVVDVLFDGTEMYRLSLPRIETNNTHGTGCTLASAIASGLAKELPLLEAVTQVRLGLDSPYPFMVPATLPSPPGLKNTALSSPALNIQSKYPHQSHPLTPSALPGHLPPPVSPSRPNHMSSWLLR